jgi:hypothetical protein
MPANTAKGYPYPLGTDRVMDGDDSIKALAEAVDVHLGRAASGVATTPVSSALNAPVTVAVTFPVGRFSAPPQVNVTAVGANPAWSTGIAATATTGGVTLTAAKVYGGNAAASLAWVAVQV